MEVKTLKIQFRKFAVEIHADNFELIAKLEKDFSYFVVNKFNLSSKKLSIEVLKSDYKDLLPKDRVVTKQTQNSLYYDIGDLRYNDYYGKALSIFDYKKEEAKVLYLSVNYAHELVYLLVLSRSGKFLDQNGFHKIHACGVSFSDKSLIFMMPSKGGKSTLFNELIRDPEIGIVSDDTPLFRRNGDLYPFPLRLGIEDKNSLISKFPYIDKEDIYEFDREYFSKKYLLDVKKLKNRIHSERKIILLNGKRSSYSAPKIIKISKWEMFKNMIEHMIIGNGLPMIVEYFLRNTFHDHLANSKILFSRVITCINVLRKSECYDVYMSSDIMANTEKVKSLLYER